MSHYLATASLSVLFQSLSHCPTVHPTVYTASVSCSTVPVTVTLSHCLYTASVSVLSQSLSHCPQHLTVPLPTASVLVLSQPLSHCHTVYTASVTIIPVKITLSCCLLPQYCPSRSTTNHVLLVPVSIILSRCLTSYCLLPQIIWLCVYTHRQIARQM